MKRLVRSTLGDMFLQIKYGFYAVYALITVIYIVILKQLPPKFLAIALPFIIFSDPSVLGFYFISGLVLLEKGEMTLEYLISTPLRTKEYLYSKMVSLTTLSILSSLAIVIFVYGFKVNFLLLVTGIILTSFFFILIGFVAVSKFPTINEYMMSSIIYITALCIPLIEYFGFYSGSIFYIFPTQASLLLIRGAFEGIELWQFCYGVTYLVLWIFITYKWAYRLFYKYIVLNDK